jgi:hypothetical protein
LALVLPYEFDTIKLSVTVLSAMLGGSAFMVFAALVMLMKSGPLAASPCLLAALLLAWVASKYMKTFDGLAKGSIQRDAVVVESSAIGPLRIPSPVGTYRPGQFKAVRVIYGGPGPTGSGGYYFAKIYLIGRGGAADICVANARDTTAKALAPEIAAAVGLPLEQEGLVPFDH